MYLVVEYLDGNELAVIPDNWLDGTKCAVWPPYKSTARIMNAVTQREVPGENWKSLPIRELYRSRKFISFDCSGHPYYVGQLTLHKIYLETLKTPLHCYKTMYR